MQDQFELAAGSTIGKAHRKAGRNNQDSLCVFQDSDITVAVVADGCGSTPYSEIGANIGSRMLVDQIVNDYRCRTVFNPYSGYGGWPDANWGIHSITTRLEKAIRLLITQDDCTEKETEFRRYIAQSFLFTLCVAVITKNEGSWFFAIGDGIFVINDETIVIESENNAPNYLAYSLLPEANPTSSAIARVATLDTSELSHFAIGSDGVGDFIACKDQTLPGKSEPLGPLEQFWQEDRYFRNPEAVNRKLRMANSEHVRYDPVLERIVRHNGLLDDDTTLVVGRRRKEES